MKISNMKTVQKLVRVREQIHRALHDVDLFNDRQLEHDSGGVEDVAATGYSCSLCSQRDGSGPAINMTGCYVGVEMCDAAHQVLITKLDEVDRALESFGVEIDETTLTVVGES